jgi:hypothetical protein
MNKLPRERRAQILGMMVEGNSIRAIVPMTGGEQKYDREAAGRRRRGVFSLSGSSFVT